MTAVIHRANERITPYSPIILETLENLIAPGHRARLSPYIEATQLQILFDVPVFLNDYRKHTAYLINQHQEQIRSLAKSWTDFRTQGRDFSAQQYSQQEFLSAYFAYYNSVNIAKIQITLFDLLRTGELCDSEWNVLDIGVGTGTTALAVGDFLLAWETVCQLHGIDFPVKKLSLTGLDQSSAALDYAARVSKSLAQILGQRDADFRANICRSQVISALEQVCWLPFNVQTQQSLPHVTPPNILIAANVLNELNDGGKANLARIILELPTDSIALLIEPGDRKNSRALMSWRSTHLLSSKMIARVGLCGAATGDTVDSTCGNCWNARRQSFLQTPLYKAFRQEAAAIMGDKRGFDDFENNLLSWSTAWVKRGSPERSIPQSVCMKAGDTLHENIELQYIGSYYGSSKSGAPGPAGFMPDQNPSSPPPEWKEYVKFCPRNLSAPALTYVRETGFQIPKLYHGQKVKIKGARLGDLSKLGTQYPQNGLAIELHTDSRILPVERHTSETDGFLSTYSHNSEDAINELGYRLFGFPSMKPFQHRIFQRVLTNHSILGIAATGSGKSECYILPAIILPGLTIVVSPLVSLMMDQYDQRVCKRYGLDHLVTYINGEIGFKERQARLRRIELGYYKMAYFTPEQLERGYILDSLRRTNENIGIRYLAMDEAHCISQWGHDFRPSYLNISRRLADYGINPVRIALTATASRFVRQDICEELGLKPTLLQDGGDIYVESSNRPELNLIVRKAVNTTEKVASIESELHQFLRENPGGIGDPTPGAAIIFMPHTGGNPNNSSRTQRSGNQGRLSAAVTPFASYLERQLGRKVAIYHSKMDLKESENDDSEQAAAERTRGSNFGDLSKRTRRTEQERFINNETNIMVATKGFGMGIDKDNIRLIIHRTPPANLEAYAQEAGRAGRDGDRANVVLYYSPDTAVEIDEFGKSKDVQSDKDIQEFFLSNKYIRRLDVETMRAFLKTLPVTRTAFLYFTNDQAIEFFDQARKWPDFPAYSANDNETGVHLEILERGHLYQQKTKYIDRILQALFRIRPNVKGAHARVTLVEQLHETGAYVLSPQIKNWKAIQNYNVYFGEIIRNSGIEMTEFARLLAQDTIIPLAARLQLTVTETASLLSDVKSADGYLQGNYWMPTLLSYKKIIAPKLGKAKSLQSLEEWREYAGARKRVSRDVANDRARRRNKSRPELNDWFSESEMYSPTGWEVQLGKAFQSDDSFEDYVNAFMELHDERERNDWNSYRRLLTDYVGANTDGSIPRHQNEKECLRSVLLGYLETYEVISGTSCFSCSHCVPKENFHDYSEEQRERAVVRMSPADILIFDEIGKLFHIYPSQEKRSIFFEMIVRGEQSGQSYSGYFTGWTSKLLNEDPDHRTAAWLRLEAMARELIPLQKEEFLDLARKILKLASEQTLIDLEQVLLQSEAQFAEDAEYYRLLSKYYFAYKRAREEERAINRCISLQNSVYPADSNSTCHDLYVRLTEIYDANPDLDNGEKYVASCCFAARSAPSRQISHTFYLRVIPYWNWQQISTELANNSNQPSGTHLQAVLLSLWLTSGNGEQRENQALSWLLHQPEIVLDWPTELTGKFLRLYPDEIILASPKLYERVFLGQESLDRKILLAIKSIDIFSQLSSAYKRQLKNSLADDFQLWMQKLETYYPEAKTRLNVVSKLIEIGANSNNIFLEKLLEYVVRFSTVDKQIVLTLAEKLLDHAPAQHLSGETDSLIQAFIIANHTDPGVRKLIISHFEYIFMDSSNLLSKIIATSTSDTEADKQFLNDLLKQTLLHGNPALYQVLPYEWPTGNPDDPYFDEIRFLVDKALYLRKKLRLERRSFHLHGDQINELVSTFNWEKDEEQADMVCTVLAWCVENDDAPTSSNLIETLVKILTLKGRADLADAYANRVSQGSVELGGRRILIRDLIQKYRTPLRSKAIRTEYRAVVRNIFGSGRKATRKV